MNSLSSKVPLSYSIEAEANSFGVGLVFPCMPAVLPPELLALSFGLISDEAVLPFLWPIEAAKRPARRDPDEDDEDEDEDEEDADDEVADDDEEEDEDEEDDEEDDEDEEEEEDEFEESESGFDDDDDDDEDEDDFDDE